MPDTDTPPGAERLDFVVYFPFKRSSLPPVAQTVIFEAVRYTQRGREYPRLWDPPSGLKHDAPIDICLPTTTRPELLSSSCLTGGEAGLQIPLLSSPQFYGQIDLS